MADAKPDAECPSPELKRFTLKGGGTLPVRGTVNEKGDVTITGTTKCVPKDTTYVLDISIGQYVSNKGSTAHRVIQSHVSGTFTCKGGKWTLTIPHPMGDVFLANVGPNFNTNGGTAWMTCSLKLDDEDSVTPAPCQYDPKANGVALGIY